MKCEKAIKETFEKVVKENKGKKIGVKAVVMKVDEQEIIYQLEGCPPSGCPMCPPLPPEVCA